MTPQILSALKHFRTERAWLSQVVFIVNIFLVSFQVVCVICLEKDQICEIVKSIWDIVWMELNI